MGWTATLDTLPLLVSSDFGLMIDEVSIRFDGSSSTGIGGEACETDAWLLRMPDEIVVRSPLLDRSRVEFAYPCQWSYSVAIRRISVVCVLCIDWERTFSCFAESSIRHWIVDWGIHWICELESWKRRSGDCHSFPKVAMPDRCWA